MPISTMVDSPSRYSMSFEDIFKVCDEEPVSFDKRKDSRFFQYLITPLKGDEDLTCFDTNNLFNERKRKNSAGWFQYDENGELKEDSQMLDNSSLFSMNGSHPKGSSDGKYVSTLT